MRRASAPGPVESDHTVLPISEKTIRSSFVNASRKEVTDLTLPTDLETRDWESLDFLGWRDPKTARRAYAVVPRSRATSSHPVPAGRGVAACTGAVLVVPGRQAAQRRRVLRREALRKAGRNGNTVGTLVCQDFQCSRNVRRPVPPAYEGHDVEAARVRRIEDLQLRVASFAAEL